MHLRAEERVVGRGEPAPAHKLKDEGMLRARVHEAIAALRESGMLIAHNDCAPPEVSLA